VFTILANSNQRYNKMCDTALSCALDQLLPLARDHLLPLLKEAFNMIRGVPKEIADLKDELESIEDFINDADRRADDVEDMKIKDMIKQLIEASSIFSHRRCH
jgi:hypothetical protein